MSKSREARRVMLSKQSKEKPTATETWTNKSKTLSEI